MAAILNLVFLIPALAFLGELIRVRSVTPVDEQEGLTAYEDRMLLGAVFGALLPALLNGSSLVFLGVILIVAAEGYVIMTTDRELAALVPTPRFHARTISGHQNMVMGLALGGAFGGFIVSLIVGSIFSAIGGLF